jgi:uncharacterized protein YjiS (DUF1127 family)
MFTQIFDTIKEIRSYFKNMKELAQLANMSGHDLKDMGINRCDVLALSKGFFPKY